MARKTPQPKEEPTTFSKSELIANAGAFGVMPEVVAGALYGVESATKEETEEKIKAFLSKEVN